MRNSLIWRALVVIVIVFVAFIHLLPSLKSNLPSFWGKIFPTKQIGLGLDLKGGIQLTLEVQLDKAVEGALSRTFEELKFALSEEKIPLTKRTVTVKNIRLEASSAENIQKVKSLIEEKFPNLQLIDSNLNEPNTFLIFKFSIAAEEEVKKMAYRQAVETITNRIDEFGLTEPDIRTQGIDRIIIQIPGEDDPQRALEVVGKTALLEFKLVNNTISAEEAIATNRIPRGSEILYQTLIEPKSNQELKVPYLIEKQTLMTGASITDAKMGIGGSAPGSRSEVYVSISMDREGAKLFERLTGEHEGRQLAIVLDGVVYSAPVIKSKIAGGRASIDGMRNAAEAQDLAVVLRAGALPAPVENLGYFTVGPSLGADSIKQGVRAGLVGIGFIFVFMILYYRGAGLIADLALLINFPLILGTLAAFGATLTLPGVFGLILTMGMAIDANVLIFERIREELRLGKTPMASVEAGFARALWTILDSNITTLLIAIILFQFGTGPIKGFAITLSVGILASMFTAIFMSRIIFDFILSRKQSQKISI